MSTTLMAESREAMPPKAVAVPPAVLNRQEMLRFLDFIEAMDDEARDILPLLQTDACFRMTLFLMRQHLQARLTTVTSLAASSGVPYATAMRRIEEMLEAGLIVRRPRTRTGKSFSLHPSQALIDAAYDYARRIKRVIGKAFGLSGGLSGGLGGAATGLPDYYFGGSYLAARIIPPPAVREVPLALVEPLRILVHADPTFMAMDNLKRQLEQGFGVAIQNRALSIDRLRLEGLKNAEAKASRYDIIALDLPWIGEFAKKGVLLPLDDLIGQEGLHGSDFHPPSWQGCRYRDQQWAVPIQTTPEIFFYRRDIFAEAGLDPPLTTAAVLDAARLLHRPHQGRRGIAWNAARGTPMGHTFLMVMSAFGRPVLDLDPIGEEYDAQTLEGKRMRPMITSAEGRLTAEYLLELLDLAPLNILTMSWFERIQAYAKGEVAMAYGYTLLAPYFVHDPASPAHKQTGFLPHPRGPGGSNIAPVGGYALGIPANLAPERREAAWQALVTLTSSEACKAYMLNGSLVSPRFSVSADPEVRALSPLIDAINGMAHTGQLQYWPRPPAPEISDVITICGEELHDMCRGLKSIDQALTDAQNRADRLMRAHGHY